MQKSILWDGLQNDTDEHCAVSFFESGIVVRSEIEGWAGTVPVYADYTLRLDLRWRVQQMDIDFHVSDTKHSHSLRRDAEGNWTDGSGKEYHEFKGCKYVDISLTPLTNTLPVNGMAMCIGHSAAIDVVYIDIIENKIYKDTQHYTRIDNHTYRFENNNGSFTADIEVDDTGFVVHYPQLFNMIQPQ